MSNGNLTQSGGKPVVGLALGSGSARGWAHIGVIQALEEMGIEPQVVAGTSVGAIVGGAYVTGTLKPFAEWVQNLTVKDVVGLLDISFSGGVVKGEKLFGFFREHHENPEIEKLDKKLVTVATDMKTGREIWITKGPMLDAARASCALPGLFSPFNLQGRWMLDGGLVNPVPVSAARAMGADIVIAVNLNAQLVGGHLARDARSQVEGEEGSDEERSIWHKVMNYFSTEEGEDPGFFDVVASSINIMQDRITRSRMAGEPPDIHITPKLSHIGLMDFDRAEESIAEGVEATRRKSSEIEALPEALRKG